MCGIFGHVGSLSKEKALISLNKLSHRGPDGYGIFNQPKVTLGHRRLAILDLSDNAKQPMSYADQRYHITYNGEVYNFLELREALSKKGYFFKSDSDTEVILAAFVEWGEACVQYFNGMWAFAIWDSHKHELFLSRDRLGKKPLFYTYLPRGKFAFASEMKALMPLINEVKPNHDLLKNLNKIFTYEATDECLIHGIKRFPAGHSGWYRNERLTIFRWWNTLDNLMEVPSRYEDQVEMFRELFLDSCRLRMRSDVPIGTALSGGLDSSATISAMAYLGGEEKSNVAKADWQHAFVASFPGTALDEVPYARAVTEHLGFEATVVEIEPLKAIDRLDEYLYLFEEIYVTSPIPFMMTYQSVKNNGISVTLDGHGADELFGGYSFDYLVALKDAGLNMKQSSQIIDTYYDSWPSESEQFSKLPSRTRFLIEYHAKNIMSKALGKSNTKTVIEDVLHDRWKSLGHLNRQLFTSTHNSVLPTLLRNYDRYSMANGVEIRMPFLDHRILSFAFSLPWTSKIRNGYSKSIIRDAISPLMPKGIAYRKTKLGFNSPIVDWMKGPLKEYLLDTIQNQKFLQCELIEPEKVAKAVRKVTNDTCVTFAEAERAWILLTPYLWQKAFLASSSA